MKEEYPKSLVLFTRSTDFNEVLMKHFTQSIYPFEKIMGIKYIYELSTILFLSMY